MSNNEDQALVDWVQAGELVGYAGNAQQEAELVGMWRELRADLARDLGQVDAAGDDRAVALELHRLRGFTSTWGLLVFGQRVMSIEKGVAPRAQWQRERVDLTHLLERSLAAVEAKYPHLLGREERGGGV